MNQAPLDDLPLWALFLTTAAIVLLAIEGDSDLERGGGGRAIPRRTPRSDRWSAPPSLCSGSCSDSLRPASSRAGRCCSTRQTRSRPRTSGPRHSPSRPVPSSASYFGKYLAARVEAASPGELEAGIRRSEEAQGRLWTLGVALGRSQPSSILVGLFMQSLNEVIDLHTTRIQAGLRSRIPGVIWAVLYAGSPCWRWRRWATRAA